jgi:hypothetical protein
VGGARRQFSAVKTSLEIQSLGCNDLEPLWLQAQAVPSTSLVPCSPAAV